MIGDNAATMRYGRRRREREVSGREVAKGFRGEGEPASASRQSERGAADWPRLPQLALSSLRGPAGKVAPRASWPTQVRGHKQLAHANHGAASIPCGSAPGGTGLAPVWLQQSCLRDAAPPRPPAHAHPQAVFLYRSAT